MRTLLLGVFFFLALAFASAHAADVYVCQGPHGTKIFQQEPCPKSTTPIAHGTFQRQPDAPSPYQPMQNNYSTTGARIYSRARTVAQPVANPPQQVAGYICTAGDRKWVQTSPCPPTYTKSVPVDVDGQTISGEHVEGTGWVDLQAPVQQQQQNRAGMCGAMGDPGVHVKHSGQSDVYERNVGKAKYCGQ